MIMTKRLFFCGFLLILFACNKDEISEPQEVSVVGTWKLSETYIGDGGTNTQWTPVENGYTYTFKSDGTFTSTKFSDCTYGNYSISTSPFRTLNLDFGCEGFTAGIETPEGTFAEKFKFIEGSLILHPLYLSCIEGCAYKFQKIKD